MILNAIAAKLKQRSKADLKGRADRAGGLQLRFINWLTRTAPHQLDRAALKFPTF